jgi:hypothetical protein
LTPACATSDNLPPKNAAAALGVGPFTIKRFAATAKGREGIQGKGDYPKKAQKAKGHKRPKGLAQPETGAIRAGCGD